MPTVKTIVFELDINSFKVLEFVFLRFEFCPKRSLLIRPIPFQATGVLSRNAIPAQSNRTFDLIFQFSLGNMISRVKQLIP